MERAACISFRWDEENPNCMVTFFEGEFAFERASSFQKGIEPDFPEYHHVVTCNSEGAEAKGNRLICEMFGIEECIIAGL